MPEIPETNQSKSGRERVMALAKRENLTVRQIAGRLGGYGGLAMMGTPKMIADQMEEWLMTDACDGFNVMFPYLPGGLDDFVEQGRARAAAPRPVPHRVRGQDPARESRPAAAGEPLLLGGGEGRGVALAGAPLQWRISSRRTMIAPLELARPEQRLPAPGDRGEVDGIGHRGVAGAVGMQLVARAADRGVGLELGLHLAGRGIERRGVEVDHAVEDLGGAQELVQRLALGVDLGAAVASACC